MDAFRAVLADLPVRLDFSPYDYRLVSTRTDPVGQALGQLLDAVRQTSQDGTWPRLKVCARDTCRWAFYDASRNQVRRWCSMAGCGNHIKMRRASATRKARAGSATPAGSQESRPDPSSCASGPRARRAPSPSLSRLQRGPAGDPPQASH